MTATDLARIVSFWIPRERVQEFWIISGSAREKLVCANVMCVLPRFSIPRMRLGPCYENTNILYVLLGLKFSFKNTDFRLTLKIKESLRKCLS